MHSIPSAVELEKLGWQKKLREGVGRQACGRILWVDYQRMVYYNLIKSTLPGKFPTRF